MLTRVLAALTLAAALAAAGACNLATPEKNTKETLTGTVPVAGQSDFNFTVAKRGEVTITITSVTPTPSSQLVMALGSLDSGRCAPFVAYLASVVVNREQLWFVEKGTYCFTIGDPNGILKATTSYTGTLSHP